MWADRDQYSFDSLVYTLLTDKLFLILLACWAINDHYLKYNYPSAVTGKLSDVTSLVCTPIIMLIVMLGCISCSIYVLQKLKEPKAEYSLPTSLYYLLLSLNACSMGTLMIAINTHNTWSAAYKIGLGYAQWPWVGIWAWHKYGHWPSLPNVHLTVDPSDAWTAPAASISLLILHRSCCRLSQESKR